MLVAIAGKIKIDASSGMYLPAKILIIKSGKRKIIANATIIRTVKNNADVDNILLECFLVLDSVEIGNIALLIGKVPKNIILEIVDAIAYCPAMSG